MHELRSALVYKHSFQNITSPPEIGEPECESSDARCIIPNFENEFRSTTQHFGPRFTRVLVFDKCALLVCQRLEAEDVRTYARMCRQI